MEGRGADAGGPYLSAALWAESTAHAYCSWALWCCAPRCAELSDFIRVGCALCCTKPANFQSLSFWMILMSSSFFNFLFIIKKPFIFSFLRGSEAKKKIQALSCNVSNWLPIVEGFKLTKKKKKKKSIVYRQHKIFIFNLSRISLPAVQPQLLFKACFIICVSSCNRFSRDLSFQLLKVS